MPGVIYDDRGAPRYSDGRPMWHGLKGEALTNEQAERLLGDIDKRRIAQTIIRDRRERIKVSTIFMPIDMGFLDEARPVLWETMVFGGSEDGVQMRYASRAAAKEGHAGLVGMIRMVIEIEQVNRARRSRMHAGYRARWA